MNCIFIGTPRFGLPCLKALINDNDINVIAVITQPDRPAGRKQAVDFLPIKKEALKNAIPVLQPEKIKIIKEQIINLKPDIIVVAAYAQIIPQGILDIPKYGCINVHGSLLPKYRGASCVQAAILNGDKKSGVTIMKMEASLDTGPIIVLKEIEIKNDFTSGDLYDKISLLAGEILVPTIKAYVKGDIKETPQDNSKASYAPMLKKENGQIDFSKNAFQLESFVRAMQPWPSAYALFLINNVQVLIKILEVESDVLKINDCKPGELFLCQNRLAMQCAKDALIINKLQPSGKKIMSGKQFINGCKSQLKNIKQ